MVLSPRQLRVFGVSVVLACCLAALGGHVRKADDANPPSVAAPKLEVGLQLYSLRDEMAKDVPAALKHVKELGFIDVELAGLYNLDGAQFKKLLDANGLHPSSIHMQYDQFRGGTQAVIETAKALGVHYVIIPWIPHKDRFTADDARTAAERFNVWGAELQKAGLQFGFHPHGSEFSPEGDGVVFDTLANQTKPDLVIFELDVFWVVHAGLDPVKFMEKYGKRVRLLHLKDMEKGTPVGQFTGHASKTASVALGMGMIDFPAILKEAKQIGVEHYYIEDEAPTAAEQIPQSLKYLAPLQ